MDCVKELATYLTVSRRVMSHSVALEIGGSRKSEADAFFALRNAFRIGGYDDAEQAGKSISQVLNIS